MHILFTIIYFSVELLPKKLNSPLSVFRRFEKQYGSEIGLPILVKLVCLCQWRIFYRGWGPEKNNNMYLKILKTSVDRI